MKKIVVIGVLLMMLMPMGAQEMLPYPLDTINGEEVYRYEVERSVGLYRISVNFNVSQADIIRMNPQLSERGVHYKEILYIPTGRIGIKETKPVVVATTVTETPMPVSSEESERVVHVDTTIHRENLLDAAGAAIAVIDSIANDTHSVDRPLLTPRGVVDLALLLPFESQQTKRSNNADRMLEFYQGVLLALKDRQQDGIQFRLRVFDTERSERRVNSLCDSTELEGVQGIIGPIYPIQIERMATWCEAHQVPMVLPFSDDSQLTKKKPVLQFNSTDRQEADSLCQWMLAHDSLIHCVTVDVREAEMTEFVRTLRAQMRKDSIASQAITLRDLLNDSVDYALDAEKENLIILHSDKYQHARILMPHLTKLQARGYRIRIVSQYSWIKEEITIPQLYTSVFTSREGLEAYEAQWSTYYIGTHTDEAPRFDLIGYDLTQALIAWLYGRIEWEGLQSVIRWQQDGEGGWQNGGMTVIER